MKSHLERPCVCIQVLLLSERIDNVGNRNITSEIASKTQCRRTNVAESRAETRISGVDIRQLRSVPNNTGFIQ